MKQREKDGEESPARLTWGQAAIGCARADVIHWLHTDRNLLRCARAAQAISFEDAADVPESGMVLREVAEHLGAERMNEVVLIAPAKGRNSYSH
ncbi:hypothetical protein [Actinomadura nitritigenes]|uniref:hypothetical protein n=1 Tax=Actinomadura nitritigenes TaxID=134602 RepID=UPI003D8F55ED